MGRDHTLFARADGVVEFVKRSKKGKVINIISA